MHDFLPSYDDTLTVDEVAQATKMCKRTIYNLIRKKQLKAIYISGKYIVPKLYLNEFFSNNLNTKIKKVM